MIKKLLTLSKLFLVAILVCGGASNAWGDTEWSTVWSADFSSAPSGMTYSVTNGSVSISNGYIYYYQGGGTGNRAINTAFTADAFNVSTDWKMEFDWNCGSANTNSSYVTFATNQGSAFTMTWAKYASAVVVTDAASTEICTTLPLLGYKQSTCSSWSHVTIIGDADAGIYLTITNGTTTYVDNVLVTSTYGYPATFNGSLGRAQASMFIDNVTLATPKVAGFVNAPTGTITAPDGTSRKFTLSCLTDGVTMYYSETELAAGDAGWTKYTGETTTAAETIYAYATDGENNSEVSSFATGAGTAITLNTPTWTKSAYDSNTGISTVTLSSDQSSLLGAPTPTIFYSIDSGDATAYSAAIEVADGSVLSYYATADGYTNSEEGSVTATAPFTGSNVWSETYASTSDYGITLGDQVGETYYMVANEATISDYLTTYNSNINGYFLYRSGGIYSGNGRTYVIQGLKEGWYVVITTASGSESATITAGSNLSTDTWNTLNNTWCFNVSADGTASFSINRYCYIKSITVKSEPVDLTITDAGWATLYTDKALNFSGVEGLTAYTATVSESTVTLTEVADVPANTGVVLKGDAGNYSIPFAASSSTAQGSLMGSVSEATAYNAYDGYTLYILTKNGDNAQFNPATSGSIAAGKAFLKVKNGGSARSLDVVINGETTGIKAVESAESDNQYYNLNGQRVEAPAKGLYIVRGKKIMVK